MFQKLWFWCSVHVTIFPEVFTHQWYLYSTHGKSIDQIIGRKTLQRYRITSKRDKSNLLEAASSWKMNKNRNMNVNSISRCFTKAIYLSGMSIPEDLDEFPFHVGEREFEMNLNYLIIKLCSLMLTMTLCYCECHF